MGTRGPVPKRSTQRRRTNKESVPETAPAAAVVTVPEPDENWHPTAALWFASLKESGQSRFYESSDWALAFVIAESISRDLKPQVVGIHEETGDVVRAVIPMKGASLSAYLKAMGSLLVTEGDRRRAGLELQRPQVSSGEGSTEVAELDDYRRRLAG